MKAHPAMVLMACCVFLSPFAFHLSPSVRAADWPQWRGPQRNGISEEKGLLQTWPKNGPPFLWTYPNAGVGYSGPAVVGGRLYLMGARGESEYVFALDVKTAKEIWSAKIGPTFTWTGNSWNAGPSATPTVDGELLYALGGQGDLVCVETASGKERWRKSMAADLGGEVNPIGGAPEKIGWGYNWSPLLDGEQLVCVPGGKQGTMAALDKKTGKVIWRSKGLTDQASYSSPIIAEVAGERHYVIMTNHGVSGVAAKDGRLLWDYRRKPSYTNVVIPTPVFHDNCVYATAGWAGYGGGSDLIKLTAEGMKINVEKVYANNKNMVNRQGGVVLVGEHLYGFHERQGWVCQDLKTGKIAWSEKRRLGAGSLTYADGHLYCYGEDEGTVVLLEANAAKWQEVSRFTIPAESQLRKPNGKIWTHPVIAEGRLYLRDQELLFCFDLRRSSR